MSNGQTEPTTAPTMLKSSGTGDPAKPQSGTATEFWLELRAYDSTRKVRSLWLLVDGAWRRLDEPSASVEASVQSAFCNCYNRLAVVVWYRDEEIVGLVVRSR